MVGPVVHKQEHSIPGGAVGAESRVELNAIATWVLMSVNRRLIVKDNETQAWQAWKITWYTVPVIALLATVAHVALWG